jgi:hypothetical protein
MLRPKLKRYLTSIAFVGLDTLLDRLPALLRVRCLRSTCESIHPLVGLQAPSLRSTSFNFRCNFLFLWMNIYILFFLLCIVPSMWLWRWCVGIPRLSMPSTHPLSKRQTHAYSANETKCSIHGYLNRLGWTLHVARPVAGPVRNRTKSFRKWFKNKIIHSFFWNCGARQYQRWWIKVMDRHLSNKWAKI